MYREVSITIGVKRCLIKRRLMRNLKRKYFDIYIIGTTSKT